MAPACAELDDRVTQYGALMSDIDQWDRLAIGALLAYGACSARELSRHVDPDQFEEGPAAEWMASALDRGIVEVTGGTGRSVRVNLTDGGRGWGR
jgi:hypothetical protein